MMFANSSSESISPIMMMNNNSNNSNRSRSIPITQDEKTLREENEQYQGEMVADYKDLIFCTRLVDGMRKQQMKRRDVALKYQNQALIDHIIDTRRGHDAHNYNYNSNPAVAIMPHPAYLRSSSSSSQQIVDTVQDVLGLVQDDDLIFDMDL